METIAVSPFLHRRSVRRRSHTPTRTSVPKSPYKHYLQPKVTFEGVRASLEQSFSTVESTVKTYLTEVDDRIEEVRQRRSRDTLSPLPASLPCVEKQTRRSESEAPKVPVRLERRRSGEKLLKRKDSLTTLLQSDRSDPDFSRIESIQSKLKGDRSVLPVPCIDDLVHEVLTKQQLGSAYKHANRPSCQPLDPISVFSHICDEHGVAPVPAIAKIAGDKLVLNRYQLQFGLCKALGEAVPLVQELRVVHLDENNIGDAGGAAIVGGIGRQGKVVSFYYTRNDIGGKMVESLKTLKESGVEDLSFKGCKVTATVAPSLLATVLQIQSLRKLCISELGLSDAAVISLTSAMRRARLTHLDLAENQISPVATKAFITFLRRDKRLQFLDYSSNTLHSSDNETAYLLGAVLRTHPCLLHLNLSRTGLNDQAAALIVQGLKKSNTILALHFSENQVENRTVENLKRHLDARTEWALMSNSAEGRGIPIASEQHTLPLLPDHSLTNLKVRDSSGTKLIAHRDSLVNIFQSEPRKSGFYAESRIFSRLIGHAEIENSEQWVFSEHCWVCERWPIFTFTVKEQALKPVETADLLLSRASVGGKVALKSSFNNWQDVAMKEESPGRYSVTLLMPPGAHKFWFLSEQFICIAKTYQTVIESGLKVNQVIVPIRSTDLEVSTSVRAPKVRVFDKSKSVFRNFIEDSDALIDLMFANDMKYSKIKRVVKDEEEFNQVKSLLRANYKEIKAIFDNTAASSNYPTIGWLDFTDFSVMCQLIDKKYLNTAAIDRLFIAVNVELVEQDENPNRELCRFEFAEIIVRIALCKYQDLPLSPVQCLQKLLHEHIFRFGTASNATDFRKDKLYQVEVNDVLEANLFSLQTVFTKYKDRRGKFVRLKGIRQLLETAGIQCNDRDLLKAFAFSKMSILDESTANGAHEKMVFVEFLEFIGRLSEAAVSDDIPLHTKIEQVLDKLLPAHGLKRKPVAEMSDDD